VNDVLFELSVVLLVDVLPDVLSVEFNRLVSESYADCASLTSPELMALKRLSTSWPRALIVEPPVVDEVSEVELVDVVLGVT
jgi:hypothetical protein